MFGSEFLPELGTLVWVYNGLRGSAAHGSDNPIGGKRAHSRVVAALSRTHPHFFGDTEPGLAGFRATAREARLRRLQEDNVVVEIVPRCRRPDGSKRVYMHTLWRNQRDSEPSKDIGSIPT